MRDENFQMLESKKQQQEWVKIHRNLLETAQKISESLENPKWIRHPAVFWVGHFTFLSLL